MTIETGKLISVIIPVYNVEDYLERCVLSVVFQTYKNLEIILVNDGSTDKSGYICDTLKDKFARIRVIHKENGGLSDARNAGMDAATGEYIAFLDSDDYIHRDMYSFLVKCLERHEADIAECDYVKCWGFMTDATLECGGLVEAEPEEAMAANYQWTRFYSTVWNKIYKTELLKDIRFVVGKIHEDEFFTYKVFYKAKKLVYIHNKMLYYQQRVTSIMGSGVTEKSAAHTIEAYTERLAYDREHNQELYGIGRKRLAELLFGRLNSIMSDKRPWNQKKKAFYIIAEELAELSADVSIASSNEHRKMMKIYRKMYRTNKFLFRIAYTAYFKLFRK